MTATELAWPSGAEESYPSLAVGDAKVALLRNGEQGYPAMLAAIAAAQSTICLETYILRNDFVGAAFVSALCARAAAGVEVNVLYDAWGSAPVSSSMLVELRRSGVRVHAFHPLGFSGRVGRWISRLWLRDHRKLLVIDGQIGFVGGLNVAADYAPEQYGGGGWRDTHLRIEGAVVLEMQQLFLRVWRRQDGEDVDAARYLPPAPSTNAAIQLISSDSRVGRLAIRRAYLTAIERASRYIHLTHGYYLPTLRIRLALGRAARRGVDIRIILGGRTDLRSVIYAARAMHGRWLKSGIRLFEWQPGVLHAKTAVIDGYWSTVGSANLDARSLLINLEANVVCTDKPFAGALEAMFVADQACCKEVTLAHWHQRRWPERLLCWLAYLVRNWL